MKRARRVQVVSAAVLAAVGGVSVVACLDDLPEPKVCPPAPVNEAGDYTPLFSVTTPGCLSDRPDGLALQSVLAGPRESCACADDECPSSASACYPEGDCPPEVIAAAGPDAKCIRLDPEDFGFGQSDASQCICGCARCASVCDGRGPVVGMLATDMTPLTTWPSVSLARHLPSRGKIGVYVRARGISNTVVALFSGDYPQALQQRSLFVMTTPLDDFSEQVFYGADFVGNKEPYAWTDEAGKPNVLMFVNSVGAGQSQLAYYEVDCVVPFVVP